VDVHAWIANDLESVRSKLTDSVLSVVPRQRWVEQGDNGGSSIAHLVLHMARHHDLAVTTAIRNRPPLFVTHSSELGLAGARSSVGLEEREDPVISAALPLDALVNYLDAVFSASRSWLGKVGSMTLDTVPSSSRRLATKAALPVDDVPWLHRMWDGKPVWWLVQWPVVGHGHAHVGEAIAVRNRMGLSPF
jgi:hypothetical protein